MKIAFLLQSFPCISETFILNQIIGLVDLGCDVRIFAFSKPNEHKQHSNISKYRLLDKTTYLNQPQSKAARRLKAASQTLFGFMRHPFIAYRLQKKLLSNYRSYSYIKLFLGIALVQEDFDVIQCHYGPIGQKALFLKDIGLKVKISTVFHGYDLSSHLTKHGIDIYQELFDKGDLFLPVSEFWKKKLISLGCPAEKIIVNHMGVDINKFKPNAEKKDKKSIKILTVARLTEKKGHCYALQALREVVNSISDVEYHIAGDGPLLGELKDLTVRLGLASHVIFHGKVNSDEVLSLYRDADIFLLPSITPPSGDMEGIPVSLMEAMACALPVIASQHSGIPELVIDGQTGFTVPEKDIDALATAIKRLLLDISSWEQMGKASREFVKKNYEIKTLTFQLLKLIKRQKAPRCASRGFRSLNLFTIY